jgi:hypothetical protein
MTVALIAALAQAPACDTVHLDLDVEADSPVTSASLRRKPGLSPRPARRAGAKSTRR